MFDALKKREPKLIDMELYHRSAVVVPFCLLYTSPSPRDRG